MTGVPVIDLVIRGRRLVFESALPLEGAARRLKQETSSPGWFRHDASRSFEGTFADGRFRVSRAVRGRNSFRMVIDGTVSPRGTGTVIDARLKLHPVVVVLCLRPARDGRTTRRAGRGGVPEDARHLGADHRDGGLPNRVRAL